MAKFIITIDGPAASGKSTAARKLAEKLNAAFLDTGAMYRAVTLAAMNENIDLNNQQKLLEVLKNSKFDFKPEHGCMKVKINDVDVTEKIRDPEVTANSRCIAIASLIRAELVKMQRRFAALQDKVVTEGRDQGTVAFADADFKFYLTADAAERAKRRLAEQPGQSFEQIKRAIEQRDAADMQRADSPLKPAADAVLIDTTNLNIDEVVEKLFQCVKEKYSQNM